MSKFLTSGRFNKPVNIDNKEDAKRSTLGNQMDGNTEKDFHKSGSKLKPPSTRILGKHKQFVIQSATLKPLSPQSTSSNGKASIDSSDSLELKSVKPLQSTFRGSATKTGSESHHKSLIGQPRSVLKSARDTTAQEVREKKKCVTIVDHRVKYGGSCNELSQCSAITSPETITPPRIRRLSEGSNSPSDSLPSVSLLPADSKTNCSETAEQSCQSKSPEDNTGSVRSKIEVFNAITVNSSLPVVDSVKSDMNVDLPKQGTELSPNVVAVSKPSISNGAIISVNSSSDSKIPSVKDDLRQSETVQVAESEVKQTELTSKPSTSVLEPTIVVDAVVTTSASTAVVEKQEEDEDDALHTKSPDGRYIRQNEEIGRGSFKTVFKGLDVETGVAIAWCELMVRRPFLIFITMFGYVLFL